MSNLSNLGRQEHPRSERVPRRSGSSLVLNLPKYAFDLVVSFLGLLLSVPLFVLVSVLIRRDSPGPIFYRGPRVGKGGRLFRILKFRTMYETPESYHGPRLTGKEDARITPLGRWLRNTKINELPQLWNVLVGDMSLVGPRPEDPEIIQSWPSDMRDEILSVKPGITSPASILYHSEESLLSKIDPLGPYFKDILPDKLRLDQLYVRNRSFTSDLDIIFWTMSIFVPRIAKIRIPEGYLFAGPFSRLIHRHISWFLLDLCTALIAAGVMGFFWRSQGPLDWGFERLSLLAFGLALLFSAVNSAVGLNRIVWSHATAEDAISLIFSSTCVTFLALGLNRMGSIYRVLSLPPLPAEMLIAIGLLAQVGFLIVRYRLRLLSYIAAGWMSWKHNVPGVGEKTIIAGREEGCQIANWLLRRSMFRHIYAIVGMVTTDDPTKQGMRLQGCLMLGGIGDLPMLVRKHGVRIIICSLPGTSPEIKEIVSASNASDIHLVFLDDLLGLMDSGLDRPRTPIALRERLDPPWKHDSLTGLPDRRLLQNRLRKSLIYASRYRTKPVIVFIGINGIKHLKPLPDQEIRDELMQIAARRLSGYMRETDTLARYGDDEFALLLENIPDEDAEHTVTKRLIDLMSKPFAIKGEALLTEPEFGLYRCSECQEDLAALKQFDIDTFHARRKPIRPLPAIPMTSLDQ